MTSSVTPLGLVGRMRRLARACSLLVQPTLTRELGLRSGELLALLAIDEGHAYPSTIGAVLGTPLPTTSRLLDGLVARGHIERQMDPSDLRRHRMHLTGKGQQALHAARQIIRQELEPRLDLPAGELERLDGALHRLEAGLGLSAGARVAL